MTAKKPQPGELESIELASRDEIAALQLERMKWTLQHAYDNVPHYKKSFDEKGVHPSDLNTLADLAKFPFTTKIDLRDNYPFGLFAVPRSQVARVHASSGTTGKPIVVGYTHQDIDNWANLVARSIRAAGGRAGDTCHIAYGYGLFTGGLGAHYGAERLGCMVVPMSGGQTEKQVQLIQDFQPEIIMVTPSYSLVIAEEFERQGIKPEDISLKIGILGKDVVASGPAKSNEYLQKLILNHVIISVDSQRELEKIIEISQSFNVETNILIRINNLVGQFSKFGIEIHENVSLVVSNKRFLIEASKIDIGDTQRLQNIVAPVVGDLIYMPTVKGLFEIKHVDARHVFFQQGKVYTTKVDCELFKYSMEEINTGITEIDKVEDDIVSQFGTDSDVDGKYITNTKDSSDNAGFQFDASQILDFTDKDPFSEGKY